MATEAYPVLPEGTHTVALGVGDLNGILRGKRIPADQWPRVCRSGNALSIALFAIDMTSDVWDTPYVNMGNGYPDMHLFPGDAVHALPWEEGVAFCFGRARGMDHEPVPIDPRGVLEAQVVAGGGDRVTSLWSAPSSNSTSSIRRRWPPSTSATRSMASPVRRSSNTS